MIRFLLDTNVVSELKKDKPDAACVEWVRINSAECGISVVTLAELRFGIERLPEGRFRAKKEREYNFLLEDYQGRFFDFDGPTATEWGRYAAWLALKFGADWWKQFDYRDTLIAATAREYGLTVATRNEKHFPGCDILNPWED